MQQSARYKKYGSVPNASLTSDRLLTVAVPAIEAVAWPHPCIVVARNLTLLLLLLMHLLFNAHGGHLELHLLWGVPPIHCWHCPQVHWHTLLPRTHEAVWSCHRHCWEGHRRGGEHARHALHGVHAKARGQSMHWGAPWAHHGIWYTLQELQT